MDDLSGHQPTPPNATLWSRGGFLGTSAVTLQPGYAPDYISVEGPHVPRRILLPDLDTADRTDAAALATVVLTSTAGVTISVSHRTAPMPYVLRNVEADELHYVQAGQVMFETEFGRVRAAEDDFVFIPRSVAYRVVPMSPETFTITLGSPQPLGFDMPTPFGMINPSVDLRRATFDMDATTPSDTRQAPYILILKSHEELTRFTKPNDPLETLAHVGGESPVWALSLRAVQPLSYGGLGGPPSHFLAAPGKFTLVFTLSARAATHRAPVHHNADYDEMIIYTRGPGAWGAVDQPGTLCIVPKGVTHHGPSEDVPEGYLAWLVETNATMRFTDEALRRASPMETGLYGMHPTAQRAEGG